MADETQPPKQKLATISKVLLDEPVAGKFKTEDNAENVIIPLTRVRLIMENGAMFHAVFPSFNVKTKEDAIAIYTAHPEIFKKMDVTSEVPK